MNPLLSMLGAVSGSKIDPGVLQSVKRMMGMLSTARNPSAALQQAASQNPMLSSVLSMVGNRDPKSVFYDAVMNAIWSDYGKTAQRYGVDKTDFWADLARDWLADDDAKHNKAAIYYAEIALK